MYKKDHLSQAVLNYNHQPMDNFDSYSPFEMYQLLYDPFGAFSPLQLKQLKDKEYDDVFLFANFHYLLQRIAEAGEIKLTAAGYLPPKLGEEIYRLGKIKDYFIETGFTKSFRETNVEILELTHILTEMTSLVKKRHQRLSLTAKGQKLLDDKALLFREFFRTYTLKYNWGYEDGWMSPDIGRLGFAYSLILLGKYGDIPRAVEFYSERYFTAFPDLIAQKDLDEVTSPAMIYAFRTFVRFMFYFNLCDFGEAFIFLEIPPLRKTPLFDKLFALRPHIDYSSVAES
jgi:hypothetical protein